MKKIKIKNDDKLVPESIASGENTDLVIVSDTEPTGENRRTIWVKGNSIYKLVNNVYTEIEHDTEEEKPFANIGFYLLKNGKKITISAAQLPVSSLDNYKLSAKFCPSRTIMSLIIYQSLQWSTFLGRVIITPSGAITISKADSLPARFEDVTDGYITFCMSYLKI